MTQYHWLMTLQGGSATQPVTMTFSGVPAVVFFSLAPDRLG